MPPKAKPSVKVDEDGDGDTDVTVEIDTPPSDQIPDDVRAVLTDIVMKMEVHPAPGVVRLGYNDVREKIRGLLV